MPSLMRRGNIVIHKIHPDTDSEDIVAAMRRLTKMRRRTRKLQIAACPADWFRALLCRNQYHGCPRERLLMSQEWTWRVLLACSTCRA